MPGQNDEAEVKKIYFEMKRAAQPFFLPLISFLPVKTLPNYLPEGDV